MALGNPRGGVETAERQVRVGMAEGGRRSSEFDESRCFPRISCEEARPGGLQPRVAGPHGKARTSKSSVLARQGSGLLRPLSEIRAAALERDGGPPLIITTDGVMEVLSTLSRHKGSAIGPDALTYEVLALWGEDTAAVMADILQQ